MQNRIRLYLPAVPYLIGVGLQVSGLTHPGLSLAAFEFAAIIAATVAWSYWTDWHQVASVTIYPTGVVQRILRWPGLAIPRLCAIRPQLFAGLLVLLLGNAAIVAFFELGQRQQPGISVPMVSANSADLAKFYGELGGLFYAQLPKGMTDDQYDAWQKIVSDEMDRILAYMRKNMAAGAEYRFADLSKIPNVKWDGSINDKHNRERNLIRLLQSNLLDMMGTIAWDKPRQ